jgi:tRNA pseudouridine55 synthase
MDGLLVVDKPAGPTSHDVVARLRRALREKRIGHTGTLDPMATGVMLMVVGKATRLARFLSASDKSYDASVRFGFATDTADAQGRPIGSVSEQPPPTREQIDAALDAFRGTFLQQPPAFSAKKIDGQRSYKIARTARAMGGHTGPPPQAPLAPRTSHPAPLPAPCRVTASRLEIVSLDGDRVTLRVDCSAGFYIRSLAHDLGGRLGVGAHLTALRRTRTGDFGLDRAVPLDAAERDPQQAESAIVPLSGILLSWPSVTLTTDGVSRVGHGQDVRPSDQLSAVGSQPSAMNPEPSAISHQPFVRLLSPGGDLLAIAERTAAGLLHPSVVLM